MSEDVQLQYLTGLFYQMAEGNPGALIVLMQLSWRMRTEEFGVLLTELANSRCLGAAIWERFKDDCDGDLDKFIEETLRPESKYVRPSADA